MALENLGLIIAIVGSGFAVVGVIVALFLWIRAESNSERSDIVNLIIEMKTENKDFHGRMCVLEERYMQLMQRLFEIRK